MCDISITSHGESSPMRAVFGGNTCFWNFPVPASTGFRALVTQPLVLIQTKVDELLPINVVETACEGGEAGLLECPGAATGADASVCGHFNDVSLVCHNGPALGAVQGCCCCYCTLGATWSWYSLGTRLLLTCICMFTPACTFS